MFKYQLVQSFGGERVLGNIYVQKADAEFICHKLNDMAQKYGFSRTYYVDCI